MIPRSLNGVEPYYLRADTGPSYLLGGVLSRPFITTNRAMAINLLLLVLNRAVSIHIRFSENSSLFKRCTRSIMC